VQVCAFGLVEAKRAGKSLENAIGGSGEVSSL
jgi:hypothetical protein